MKKIILLSTMAAGVLLTFVFASSQARAAEPKLRFRNWQKYTYSPDKTSATKTTIYRRAVNFNKHHFTVGVITHTHIDKVGSKKVMNTAEVEGYLIYGMQLSHIKRRTVGKAHVVEGYWDAGHRFYRLFTQETDKSIDVATFMVRSLYINNVALEAEYIQRSVMGNLKDEKSASILNKIGDWLEPSAYAQAIPAGCDPANIASCLSGALTGGSASININGMTEINNQLQLFNTTTAPNMTAQVAQFNANLPSVTASLNNIAAAGNNMASTVKYAVDNLAKMEQPVKLVTSSALVIAAGIITSNVVGGLVTVAGKGFDAIWENIRHSKERAAMMDAFHKADAEFVSKQNETFQLEKTLDSVLSLAMKAKNQSRPWNIEDLLAEMDLQQGLQKDLADDAKEKAAGPRAKFIADAQAQAKKDGKPFDSEKVDFSKCEECMEASREKQKADGMAGAIKLLTELKGQGVLNSKEDICNRIVQGIKAAGDSENLLQQYRETYAASKWIEMKDRTEQVKSDKADIKYSADPTLLNGSCNDLAAAEKSTVAFTEKVDHSEFTKDCTKKMDKLPSLKDWVKNPDAVLKSTIGTDNFIGPDGTSTAKIARITSRAEKPSYHIFACDATVPAAFGDFLSNAAVNDWLNQCYQKIGDDKAFKPSNICASAYVAFKDFKNQNAAKVIDCAKLKETLDERPSAEKVAVGIDLNIVNNAIDNDLQAIDKIDRQQRCYTTYHNDSPECKGIESPLANNLRRQADYLNVCLDVPLPKEQGAEKDGTAQ